MIYADTDSIGYHEDENGIVTVFIKGSTDDKDDPEGEILFVVHEFWLPAIQETIQEILQ
tara:strand:- start:33840 stop:34016 length:177 start_codon:yes stop_codon:yes gene_type:complete